VITLEPVTFELARAVIEGRGLGGIVHAPDWPHADTFDALRPLAEHPEHTGPGTFLVLVDGVVVGDCGWFGPPDADGEVEIGYGLAPSVRGQGLGTETVRGLLDWVRAHGATRVRAEVLPGNEASLRLLHRLGFEVAGEHAGHVVLVA
jgi:RimJ/RimL family protein N-acetyltransferase